MSSKQNKQKQKAQRRAKEVTAPVGAVQDRQRVRELHRATQKATKSVVSTGMLRQGPSTAKGLVKRVTAKMHPESDLALWAKTLARPFDNSQVFCPVSYNPAPSFIQTTARTTSTNLNLAVAANSTTQMMIWPGHTRVVNQPQSAGLSGDENMDATSYHSVDSRINGGYYVIGPMNKQDGLSLKTAAIGARTSAIAIGTMANDTNGGTSTAMLWDVALPYVSQTGNGQAGEHSRWQLVSMGLRIHNTTPELSRGGNVVTVQPNTGYSVPNGANQSVLEVFPTFKDHGVGNRIEVAWIPRAQDMAFWHGADVSAGVNYGEQYLKDLGIMAFFNNPTAAAQAYTYEVVCNWQLAGEYLNTVGRPAAHAPELKPAIEKTLSYLTNTSPSAAPAVQVASAAVEHSGFASPISWHQAAAGIKAGAALLSKLS